MIWPFDTNNLMKTTGLPAHKIRVSDGVRLKLRCPHRMNRSTHSVGAAYTASY